MTDINAKIARWAGTYPQSTGTNGRMRHCRNYSGSDSVAIELLKVLAVKEYSPCLHYDLSGKWCLEVYYDGDFVTGCSRSTIADAICSAILQLIEEGHE